MSSVTSEEARGWLSRFRPLPHRPRPGRASAHWCATSAATGAISGAVVLIAPRAIYDLPTAAIASLAVLWRFKVPEPLVVLVAGAIGIGIFVLRGMV